MERANKWFVIAPLELENLNRGISSRNLEFCKQLTRRNFEVELITTNFNHRLKEVESEVPFLPNKIKIKVLKATQYKKNISFKRLIFNWHVAIKIMFYLLINGRKDDAVLVNSIPPELLFLVSHICYLKKISITLDCRDIWPDAMSDGGFINICFRSYCNFLYHVSNGKSLNNIVYVAKTFTSWIDRYFPKMKNREFIPLGYDEQRWLGLTSPKRKTDGPLKLIYIGYMNNQSNIESILLEVESCKNIEILVIGGGEDYKRISGLKKRWSSVRFTGMLHPLEVINQVNTYQPDIGLICLGPSGATAMPNKLFDYIAIGVGVLSVNAKEVAMFLEQMKIGKDITGNEAFINSFKLSQVSLWRDNIKKIREEYTMQELTLKMVNHSTNV